MQAIIDYLITLLSSMASSGLPTNTRRRISYDIWPVVKQVIIEIFALVFLILLEEIGRISFGILIWPLILLLIITHVFHAIQNGFMHLSNRYEILYIMCYSRGGANPETIREGYKMVINNQKRLQHLISHYLYTHYDLGGLIPPPRSNFEEKSTKSNYLLPEARYLLRTLNDNSWKSTITMMIKKCKLIIIECSDWSKSIEWEVSEVIRLRGLKKIILVADEGNIDSALKTKEKIIALSKIITKRKKSWSPKILIHRNTQTSKFGSPDKDFAVELINRVYSIAPTSDSQIKKMKHIAYLRLSLGYIWMTSLLLSIVYFVYQVFYLL